MPGPGDAGGHGPGASADRGPGRDGGVRRDARWVASLLRGAQDPQPCGAGPGSLRRWPGGALHAGPSVPYCGWMGRGSEPAGKGQRGGDMQQPTVVSETVQEFLGKRFYRCGRYFQRRGRRLHREVLRERVGELPPGAHVHHLDHDEGNNSPGNLVVMGRREHLSHHWYTGPPRTFGENAREAAARWHRSQAGRAWHRKHWSDTCRGVLDRTVDKDCEQCGSAYTTTRHAAGRSRFCSPRCKAAWRRAQRVDHETRTCVACGAAFSVERFAPTRACSRRCAWTLHRRGRA